MTALTVPAPPPASVLLNVTWAGYVQIGEILRDQPIRMNYSCGSLEIMTLSLEHERIKKLLGKLVDVLADELKLDLMSGGSTTFKDEELDRGFEPDECYWIEHEKQMREKDTFDPDVDPPPDLAIEIEISRSIINRLKIYAALAIPEIWRYDGKNVKVLLRGADGQYHPCPTSNALPIVPVGKLARFLKMRHSHSETTICRRFRAWVRKQQASWRAKKPRRRTKQ